MSSIQTELRKNKIRNLTSGFDLPAFLSIGFWLEDFSSQYYPADKPIKKFQFKNNLSFHYVISGKGEFYYKDKAYKLSAGDAFIVLPNSQVKYFPDKNDPWFYCGISTSSKEATALINKYGVLESGALFGEKAKKIGKVLTEIIERHSQKDLSDFELAINLCKILAVFEQNKKTAPQKDNLDEYVSLAVSYLKENMSNAELKIEDAAKIIGISHSYLCKIFKAKKGVSVKRYLVDLRLRAAAHSLKNTNLPVSEIGWNVGFLDMSHFCKSFAAKYGKSPSAYKKSS